ncbi:MAG: glycosyltransferase family 9 protein [Sphaerobacter sp.]|nr:glycosyltransferase family 9 protein [Sphaerobacter sp.]
MNRHRLRDAGLRLAARIPVAPAVPRAFELMLLRPDHLGDVLFLTPALRRLRQALPDATITAVVGPWGAPVLAGNPDVDEVLTLPFPGFTRRPGGRVQPYRLLACWARILRERAPAAVVVLRDDHWWGALLAQRAGVPLRIGADHPAVAPYLTHRIPLGGPHWVQRNAALLDATVRILGGTPPEEPVTPATAPLRPPATDGAEAAASTLLAAAGVSGPYLAVVPGAGAPVKHWLAPRWAAVATEVARAAGMMVVLTGSSSEAALIDQICAAIGAPAASLAGRTDLPTLAAILRRARLAVGVDSGPMHLAVAVGTPTVHLFGPSSVDDFGPWGAPRRHRVVSAGLRCPRCGDLSPERPEGAGCMVAISTEAVLAAVQEVLADG